MPNAAEEFVPDTTVLEKFIRWIEGFDQRYARAWAKLYRNDPQAATCEAMYWGVLMDCGVAVKPNADLTGKTRAPDFVCHKGVQKFYVEVTCIQFDTATKYTGLEHIPNGEPSMYQPLNDAIYQKVVCKTEQCANLDAPCVLGIGTFHCQASALCVRRHFIEWLLSGKTSVASYFDPHHGKVVGESFQVADISTSTFVRPSSLVGIEPARQPISAALIAGFGCKPPKMLGVVHPNPVREFDTRLLSRIALCELRIDIRNAMITTEWTRDPEL